MIDNVPKLSHVIFISFLKKKIFQDICHESWFEWEHSALEVLTMWFKMYHCLTMEVLMKYWESQTCEKFHLTITTMSSLLERGDTRVIRKHLSSSQSLKKPVLKIQLSILWYKRRMRWELRKGLEDTCYISSCAPFDHLVHCWERVQHCKLNYKRKLWSGLREPNSFCPWTLWSISS